ncbi:hypothetical protein [Actinospongicola halichondriae]|uniref:hypothetical protein n=1 Tax=Actinospongicola halichondriae TaxID=3236844 RepID=UPI003D53595A
MSPPDNPHAATSQDDPADEQRFREISAALVAAVAEVVPAWIERLVIERVRSWSGEVSADVEQAATTAGVEAAADVVPRMQALVETDLDHQRTNPLSLLRDTTRFAHEVLVDVGVPTVARDPFVQRSFPDDDYGLVPASWDEVDPSLHELGLTWGAAKAFLFKARRRAEGKT